MIVEHQEVKKHKRQTIKEHINKVKSMVHILIEYIVIKAEHKWVELVKLQSDMRATYMQAKFKQTNFKEGSKLPHFKESFEWAE